MWWLSSLRSTWYEGSVAGRLSSLDIKPAAGPAGEQDCLHTRRLPAHGPAVRSCQDDAHADKGACSRQPQLLNTQLSRLP